MKNFLAVLALASLASVATAQNNGQVENGGAVAGANSGALSGSYSNAENRAISGSTSLGVADTSSGAAAGSNSSITMNVEASQPLPETRNISTINTNTHLSGTTTVKSAPGIAMSGPASGPCTGRSGGLGASWLGGGVGLNYAEVDRGCMLRENARMFAMILPVLDGDDKGEARAMLMDTLRTMHAEQNSASPKK